MLNFKTVLKIGGKQTLGKVKTHDKDGVRQQCIEVKWATGVTERVLCFDGSTGNLLSVEYPREQNQNPPDISRVEYRGFKNLGDKHMPYEIQALRDRTVVLTAKVTEVTATPEDDPAQFTPPTNSEFWPQCEDVRNPELIKSVQPKYPTDARSNGEQGRVAFYAVVETDGTLSHITLTKRATPALETAASEAIRQWRYKPAACGSEPIRMEISIKTDFWLQR
jgi:protein TonB